MIFQVLSSPSAFDLDFLVKTNRNLRLILGPQSADKKGYLSWRTDSTWHTYRALVTTQADFGINYCNRLIKE
jgi:hypothetical protein